jgi:hypothetical protein
VIMAIDVRSAIGRSSSRNPRTRSAPPGRRATPFDVLIHCVTVGTSCCLLGADNRPRVVGFFDECATGLSHTLLCSDKLGAAQKASVSVCLCTAGGRDQGSDAACPWLVFTMSDSLVISLSASSRGGPKASKWQVLAGIFRSLHFNKLL